MKIEKVNIAVIGQGYVGLPLAIEFGKKYPTIGFDINQSRIVELKKGIDNINDYYDPKLKFDRLNELGFSKTEFKISNNLK